MNTNRFKLSDKLYMKQQVLILLTLIFSLSVSAQKIQTERILKVSDSILLANTNEELFKQYEVSVGSYYKYQRNKYITTGKFLSKKALKSKTTEIWVLYHFNYSKIKGIRGGTWIKLDNNLKLIDSIELEYIPDFLWKGEPCNFISKEKALELGIKEFEKNGIEIKEPVLEYNKKHQSYIYTVTNILTKMKNQIGKDAGQTEVVILEAVSGRLIEKYDGAYGIIIR